MSLRNKVILTIVLLGLFLTCALVLLSIKQIEEEKAEALIDKSRAILSRLESVRNYIADQGGLKNAIQEVKLHYPNGVIPEQAKLDILKKVPIFAAMKVGADNAQKERYRFRIISNEPRKAENLALGQEKDILKYFKDSPKTAEYKISNSKYVAVYRPVYLSEKQGCLNCHGDPTQSPWGNGKDILGYKMENWNDGKLHGAFGIISDLNLESVQQTKRERVLDILIWSFSITAVFLGIAYYFLHFPLRSISKVTSELDSAGNQISFVTGDISNNSGNLNISTKESVEALETSSLILDELVQNMKSSLKMAQTTLDVSRESRAEAEQSYKDFLVLLKTINNLRSQSTRISEIVMVLDEIAFQTNLLSLNASVVAARAGGEDGKSFSVVAEEVRKLSQRSLSSSKEIAELINGSVSLIDVGHKLATESSQSLSGIVKVVEKTASLNEEIAQTNSNQLKSVANLLSHISRVRDLSGGNYQYANQSSLVAVQLEDQARKLSELVDVLRLTINGQKEKKESVTES